MIPRGLGRSYGDAAQNGGGDVVRCTQLDRILELDIAKGTCTVEAGVSIEMLMRVFLPLGWFPMVVPGTRYVTVGGAIASEIHGKFRHGSFADSVERMTVATPERGALTVDHDDDVFWATAGGMGLTGIVTEATLQLQPVETAHMVVDTERADDLDDCMARMLDGDDRYRYSVAWIDCLSGGKHLGRSVLTRGNHAPLDSHAARRSARRRARSRRAPVCALPPWMPNGLINSLSTRAFNEMWFRKAPRERRDQIQTITAFFHPLDAVLDWNRIYGSHGFVQYQFVVPYGAEAVVRTVLERLSAQGCASFLAVLKRFEHDSRAMLGFPDGRMDARARRSRLGRGAHVVPRRSRRPRGRGGRSRLPHEGRAPAARARPGDVPAARSLARSAVDARSSPRAAQRHGPPARTSPASGRRSVR